MGHDDFDREQRTTPVRRRWFRAAWSALSVLGAVVLVTAGYRITSGVRLPGVGPESIRIVRWMLGILSVVVAGTLVSWLILRQSSVLFPAPDWEASPERPVGAADRAQHFARWFILMRWIAIVVVAVLTFVAIGVADILPRSSWRPLMLTVAGLAALNAGYVVLLRSARGVPYILLLLQAYGDLVLLVVLLHFAGGVENPLAILMLFHVIIAGVVLPRRQCYLVAGVGSLLFGLLALAEWAHWIQHYTLRIFPHFANGVPISHAAYHATFVLTAVSVQTSILLLTAYFTTTVTERLRRGESQLRVFADRLIAQRQVLERALDTTATGLRVRDRTDGSSWANQRWGEWFSGGSPDGVDEDFTGEPGPVPPSSATQDSSGRVTEITVVGSGAEVRHPAAERRIYQLTTAPLRDAAGEATHVVQVAVEVTQQRRLQEGMVRAEKLAAVGELAGKVAHEVNNPIAIISAKSRLLLADQDAALTPRVAGELNKITDLADRVARIAQGLLSYCQPAQGPATPLDLRIPVRRALESVEPAARGAGVAIEEHLEVPIPQVRVNGVELEQVFLNLFMNALDAMPDGGRLRVSAGLDGAQETGPGRCVEVVIEDTGRGIPAAIRDSVFEPFVTTKRRGQGTGLGLSICQGLVRGNGGEIGLDSVSGRGTRAHVRFPVFGPAGEEQHHG